MSRSLLQNSILALLESAADETFIGEEDNAVADARDLQTLYYELVIRRANAILDKRRDNVFTQVLRINSRGAAERAYNVYSKEYLLSLELSLEATSDLAKELIARCKGFKVPASDDWLAVSKFDITLGEDEEAPEVIYPRKVADI